MNRIRKIIKAAVYVLLAINGAFALLSVLYFSLTLTGVMIPGVWYPILAGVFGALDCLFAVACLILHKKAQ